MPEFTDTKSYAAFKDGYNAGLARDEQSKDRILSRANDALYDDCKKYNRISSKNINYFTPPVIKRVGTEDLFVLYKNDVEFTNSFREQVLKDERAYFEKKYSKPVYLYLLDKRTKYNDANDAPPKSDPRLCPTSTTNSGTDISGGGGVKDKCDSTFQTLYDKLTQYYPYVSSDTIYRKIEYRDTEHQLLMTFNHFINIIYYVLLFIMVILLASSNRLLIKERFLIYFLLVLLPFLYPYLFNIGKKIFNSLFISKPIHGPKNAFVEIPPPNIDGFNN
jgi:hypothetical protein